MITDEKDKVDWTEYKAIRQYQSFGDVLESCKLYGYRGGIEDMLDRGTSSSVENGHDWLVEDLTR